MGDRVQTTVSKKNRLKGGFVGKIIMNADDQAVSPYHRDGDVHHHVGVQVGATLTVLSLTMLIGPFRRTDCDSMATLVALVCSAPRRCRGWSRNQTDGRPHQPLGHARRWYGQLSAFGLGRPAWRRPFQLSAFGFELCLGGFGARAGSGPGGSGSCGRSRP